MKERKEIFFEEESYYEETDGTVIPRPHDVPLPPQRSHTFRTVGRICLSAIALLVPFIFLPITEDPVGINKLIIVSFLSLIGLICFLGCIFEEQKFEYPRSWFFSLLLLFVVTLAVGAFFSVAPAESWYGYLSQPDSFLAFATYTLIFFLTSFFFRREDIRKVCALLGIGLLVSSLISLLQICGLIQGPSPTGSVIQWGILMMAGVAALAGADPRSLTPFQKKFFLIFAVVAGVVLFLLNYQFLWLAVALFTIALAALRFEPRHQFRYGFIVIVLALFFALIGPRLPNLVATPSDARPSITQTSVVAEGVLQGFRTLIGSGPATFSLDYAAFRPISINQTSFWNLPFDQGHDFILTLLATGGLIGFVIFLAMLAVIGDWFLRMPLFDSDRGMVLSAAMFLVVALFFYPGFFAGFIILFMLLGLFSAEGSRREISFRTFSHGTSFFVSIVIVALAAITLVVMYGEGQQYVAAILFGQSEALAASQNTSAALAKANEAIDLDPSDEYFRGFSQIFLQQAQQVVSTPELGSTVADAVQAAEGAVGADPRNPTNWGNLGSVYEATIPVASGADVLAENSYEKAAELDPANPEWDFVLGRVFMEAAALLPDNASGTAAEQADWSEAETALEKALSLKNDYADPRLLLVQLYLKEGNVTQAIERVQELAQENPLDPGVAFELGYLYYENNEISQAQQEFQVATIVDPNYSNARYFLGMIYSQEGMTVQAIQQFELIEALNPNNQEIKNIIASLEAGQPVPQSAASSTITAPQPNEISIPSSQSKNSTKGK